MACMFSSGATKSGRKSEGSKSERVEVCVV